MNHWHALQRNYEQGDVCKHCGEDIHKTPRGGWFHALANEALCADGEHAAEPRMVLSA